VTTRHLEALSVAPDVIAKEHIPGTVLTAGPHRLEFAQLEDVMAIEPGALGKAFFPGFFSEPDPFERSGPLGIVTIDGPLMQRGGWFWDGYEDIASRFSAALGDDAVQAVVLRINSPGGMCAGLFECVAAMARTKEISGKPVVAYADEMAASAAYAIASIADHIMLPQSGRVGSVGTVITLVEQSKMLHDVGLRVEVIATGKQKTDGHPAIPLSEEVIARFRATADHLNAIFVGQVAQSRGMAPEKVLALEAGMYMGDKGVASGLADSVGGFADAKAKAEQLAKSRSQRAATMTVKAAVKETSMDENEKKLAAMVAHVGMLAAIFGLAATAGEREVQDRARSLVDGERQLLQATGKTTVGEAMAVVTAWKDSHEKVSTITVELAALRKSSVDQEMATLIASAEVDGRIVNEKQREYARSRTSVADLKAYIETQAPVAGGTLKKDAVKEAEGGITLTEADRETAKQIGITDEAMLQSKRETVARKAG
jgi:signal peptide peptidase SppA